MKLPEIKKEVKAFLSDESGVISKESILKTGIIIGGLLAAAKNTLAADNTVYHANNIEFTRAGEEITAGHTHHANHSNFT